MNKPDIIDKIIISQEEIRKINKRIYSELFTYCKDSIKNNFKSINVIVILKGADIFATNVFTKMICIPEAQNPIFNLLFIEAKSYKDNKSIGKVNIDFGSIIPEKDITNKHILIVDDIYDTGRTLCSVVKKIKKYNPKSLECCVFIERNIEHEKEVDVKFVGKKIDTKEFLIGYGLDYNGRYRELPYIATINKKF